MLVEVVYALPERHVSVQVELELGATVSDALRCSEIERLIEGLDVSRAAVGVFGEVVSVDHPLRPGDRVEIYRSLRVDPRDARRQRARAPQD